MGPPSLIQYVSAAHTRICYSSVSPLQEACAIGKPPSTPPSRPIPSLTPFATNRPTPPFLYQASNKPPPKASGTSASTTCSLR